MLTSKLGILATGGTIAAVGAVVGIAFSAAPVATVASVSTGVQTASLSEANVPDTDSGISQPVNDQNGPVWAYDTYKGTFHLTDSNVAVSNCGTSTGSCYHFTGNETITGAFITVPGGNEPNTPGSAINPQVGGSITGSFSRDFYSTDASIQNGSIDAQKQFLTTTTELAALFPAGATVVPGSTDLANYSFTYQNGYGNTFVENTTNADPEAGNITGSGKLVSAAQIQIRRSGTREYARAFVSSASRLSVAQTANAGRRVYIQTGAGLKSVLLTTGANGWTAWRELSPAMSKAVEFRAVAEAGALRQAASSGYAKR